MGYDDYVRLRQGDMDDDDDRSRADQPIPPGVVAFAGVTATDGAYPTAANVFYAITPTGLLGPEQEGSAFTSTALPGKVYAYNFGTKVPPLGAPVLVYGVPDRFAFGYFG